MPEYCFWLGLPQRCDALQLSANAAQGKTPGCYEAGSKLIPIPAKCLLHFFATEESYGINNLRVYVT